MFADACLMKDFYDTNQNSTEGIYEWVVTEYEIFSVISH